jgi:AAHS family 4-hydroxybenzoate transporter-like MFS transporter
MSTQTIDTRQQTIDVPDYIDKRKLNAFNFQLVVLSFLVIMVDGYDITVAGFAVPQLAQAWGITNPGAFGPALGASLIGMLFGAPLLGHVGDRYGRKTAILISYVIFGVFTLATAWVGSLGQLALLRLLAGVGIGGLLPNVIALNAEFAPRRLQATAVIVSFAGITIGGSLPGPIAIYLMPHYGWPILFYLGGLVPLLLAGLIAAMLPESIRFLALKDRQAEAAAMVQRMDPGTVLPQGVRFTVQLGQKLPFRKLFEGRLAIMTPLLWALFVVNLMAYFFLVLWMPTLLQAAHVPARQAALATTLLQIGGCLGSWAIAVPLDRRGMLPIVALFVISVPVIGAIGYVAARQDPFWLMVIVMLAGFCTLGAQSGLNAISAILYPTALRSTGSGSAFGIGRVGAIAGPFVGGWLIGLKFPVQDLYMIATIPFVVGAVVAFILMPMFAERMATHGPGR